MGLGRDHHHSLGLQREVHDRQMHRSVADPGRQDVAKCHVYMVLPGATDFTTAGVFETGPNRDGVPQGRFVYCRSYLDNPDAVPVDPIYLYELSDMVYRTTMFKGIFGSLRDASPQRLGRNIIIQTSSRKPPNHIDFLLRSPDDRVGALGFGCRPKPRAPKRNFYHISDLEKLATLTEKMTIVKAKPVDESGSIRIRDLMLFRTSLAGFRPKVVVEDAEGLWIAKFNCCGDEWNHARVEHAMLDLARSVGIRSVRSRVETVAGRDVLLVKRFDREWTDNGYQRFRTISGYTALRTDLDPKNWKGWRYSSLAEELRRISANPRMDSKELFARMVFNALISNKNDGPGNHSIIAENAGWKLSPAYDLLPRPSIDPDTERRIQAMNFGIHGRSASKRNLLSECGRFNIRQEEATAIIDTMEHQIGNSWYGIARNAGVSENDRHAISPAFAHPDFQSRT